MATVGETLRVDAEGARKSTEAEGEGVTRGSPCADLGAATVGNTLKRHARRGAIVEGYSRRQPEGTLWSGTG